MLKLKKIICTVIIFLLVMLFICLGISLYKVVRGEIILGDVWSKTGFYFLYTIGYGSLDGDEVLEQVLAMLGIISLALLTTYLTINLFWRLDDVRLGKNIIYHGDTLSLQFQNLGRTICDMKATFVLYDENSSVNTLDPKEYYMPVLVKKSFWNLTFDLSETFWYRAVYELLANSKKLYCVFSFVDTKTGQSSIKVEEITKENLKTEQGVLDYQTFVHPVVLSCQNLLPVANNGEIKVINQDSSMTFDFVFRKKDAITSFVMLYYNFHEKPLNLEKYHRETTFLEMTFACEQEVHLTIEIKLSQDIKIVKEVELKEEKRTIAIPLQEIKSSLEEVREICYTIFKKNNPLKGSIEIYDFKIITK